ncbi:hypothetical protein CRENBAI_003922 [Crenichthys baileyi]|uniref:Uncharacterized protein n=1 Tax=Crenichthys baileyi TaxID=28760 RepID=A0AAV9QPG1_9TELE
MGTAASLGNFAVADLSAGKTFLQGAWGQCCGNERGLRAALTGREPPSSHPPLLNPPTSGDSRSRRKMRLSAGRKQEGKVGEGRDKQPPNSLGGALLLCSSTWRGEHPGRREIPHRLLLLCSPQRSKAETFCFGLANKRAPEFDTGSIQ